MASMIFGYTTYNKKEKETKVVPPRIAACWAALRWGDADCILKEVVWIPERGHSDHIKLLLPRIFPDIAYEEFESTYDRSDDLHYAVRFPNLDKVYRGNFMFRMFVIRNIDRDVYCTRSFEYFIKNGFDPLKSAAVAANLDIRKWWNGKMSINQKDYASCFSTNVTVADVNAFARAPHKVKHKYDSKFSKGRGYYYEYHKTGMKHSIVFIQSVLAKYKPSAPQFSSRKWGDNLQKFLSDLFKKGKKPNLLLLSKDLASLIHTTKVG